MHLMRRVFTVRSISNTTCRNFSAKISTTENLPDDHIEIPNRIHRSSTDILYTLASTVGRDSTAAHYKYHDDPYLIPNSNVGKRTFAMAQEAGRNAAKWIKEEHRDLFLHQEADPPIKEFAPKMVFNEESEVDESTLQQLINMSEVNDAVFVYNLMKQKGMELSEATKQSFLELLCFYNNTNPLSDDAIEERWFEQNVAPRDRHRKTWKDGDLAEQIFNEIEPKTASAYSAIVRGMAKYYQAERAYALFQEAIEKQFQMDTSTFNSIINIASLLKETADLRWEFCCDLLQRMSWQKLKPDLDTMNALLECISTFSSFKFARSCCLKVLAEFKLLGIEPCLGTYYYVLIIFCRDRAPVSHVIVDILREIEGKSFEVSHSKDTFFFATAMDVCRNHLHDKSLAKKVDDLLHTGNNYDLIGDSYKESIYYRHYFALLCRTEPLEEFMKTYDLLVPNIYIPEPGIMEELLKVVEINGAIELVPRLWSDMVIFDHTSRESLLTRILNIMNNNLPNVEIPVQQQLPEQFAKVALDIFNKIGESEGRARKLSFTGQSIGNILSLVVRSGNFEKAVEVFNTIDKNQHRIPGTPSDTCLLEFIDACIMNRSPSQALACLEYAVDNNMESLNLAKKINAGLTLNELHLSKIKSLVGDKFLEDERNKPKVEQVN